MALHLAFSKRAQTLGAAQVAYKQSVIFVNTEATGIYSSKLGVLNTLPPDWQDYLTAHRNARSHASDWIDNVMGRLLDVPADVQGYNDSISMALQDAKYQAQLLITNSANKGAKSALKADLDAVKRTVSLVLNFVSGTLSALQSYQSEVPKMAEQLQSIANKSSADAGADQAKIDALNDAIDQLKADIKSLTTQIVALSIADGIAIVLGVVATIAAWPVGALAWLVLGPVVAVATTFIALDAEKIKTDKALIESKQSEITGISQDVAVLQGMAKQYGDFAKQTTDVQSNLENVVAEWQTLDNDVTSAVKDIQAAIADQQAPNYQAVADDLDKAIAAWTAAYNQAGSLVLEINVNNAPLSPGMSGQEVQTALAAGQITDLITYFNEAA
ncbi:enterotoxin (HBL) [Burkholderia ubonensis]|uniref:HBL/NHE enterotoxin family protein n=1 Tax=Burkholderia ubonensis TaxID=101571 RepID=UPI0007582544|nr:HBL/NHE enterotoxin family protein [Burkholderia ubonensis]KVP72267.1 enterotoxin (HBL) [Burkholderia ubonensis]